ncbi:MAG TPA: hypothetical protein VJJ82_02890 [Candidatus Nanoarchaeia archaeon]|nr:hypothetical protein [Candidatus Nanoarchaeia archaeon]
MPENRGLTYVLKQGLLRLLQEKERNNWELDIYYCRGENIPITVYLPRGRLFKEYFAYKQPVIGVTGEDLFLELQRDEEDDKKPEILEKLNLKRTGPYKNFAFGLPTLCLLGKGGLSPKEYAWRKGSYYPKDIPELKGKTIAIPEYYPRLIMQQLEEFTSLEGVRWIILDGKVDVTAAAQGIEYVVDIIGTGTTCERVGLGVIASLGASDGVLIGNPAAQKLWKDRKQNFIYNQMEE